MSAASATAFALRPLERNPLSASGNALEGAFRVYLTQREQKSLGLANGDLVRLRTAAGFRGYAVAWLASSPNPGNKPIAKVTDLLREQYGLLLNDPVFVEKAVDAWKPLRSIEVSCPESAEHKFASDDELLFWVRYALGKVDPGLTRTQQGLTQLSGPRHRPSWLHLPRPAAGPQQSAERLETTHRVE
jgi:AAA family ATPase